MKISIRYGGLSWEQMDMIESQNLRVYQCYRPQNLYELWTYFKYLESRHPFLPN